VSISSLTLFVICSNRSQLLGTARPRVFGGKDGERNIADKITRGSLGRCFSFNQGCGRMPQRSIDRRAVTQYVAEMVNRMPHKLIYCPLAVVRLPF
jgi:hypothetical protein